MLKINQVNNMDALTGIKLIRQNFIGKSIIIITDPPYNIGYKYDKYKDNLSHDDYGNLLQELAANADKSAFIHYPTEAIKYFAQFIGIPDRVITWVYNSNMQKQSRHIYVYGQDKIINVYQDYKNPKDKRIKERIASGKRARAYDWWNIDQVKNVSKEKTGNIHTCPVPLKLMENLVSMLGTKDCIIVDHFAGSGTTCVAAKKLGFNFIGFEISENYTKFANERINKGDSND